MAGERAEVVPLVLPPLMSLLFNAYGVTRRVIELGVDLSGDEELVRSWYLHVEALPILRHVDAFLGLVGLLTWLSMLVFVLPKALRGHFGFALGVLKCFPLAGITFISFFVVKVQSLAGPGVVPGIEVREHILRARLWLLGAACAMTASEILKWHVATWGLRCGVRKAAEGSKREALVEGVPDGMEIAALTEPGLVEIAAQLSAFWLCIVDLGIALEGDEDLTRKWLERRGSLPVVRHFFGLLAVAACAKLLVVLAFKLPEAFGGVPGSRAGSVLLVSVPALACLAQWADEAAMPKATAVAKAFLVALALWGHGAEKATRNKGITAGLRLHAGDSCDKGLRPLAKDSYDKGKQD